MKTLAEALVNERKQKNVSLEQIADQTNIKLNALQALERGDFNRLPGKFYFKNYVKTYLQAIESDEKEFFRQYGEIVNKIAFNIAEEKESIYYPKLRYSRFKKRSVILTLVVIAAVIIAAVAGAYYYPGNKKVFSILKPDSVALEVPDIPVTVPHLSGAMTSDRAPVRVEIDFIKGCWLQVIKGSDKIIEHVFNAGDKAVVNGYDIQVTMGNPSGLRFLLNGKEVKYLKTLARSERMVINPVTLSGILER